MPQVQVIQPIQQQPKRLRVAAYARVSSDSEDQLNSLAVQVDYYTHLIQENPNWEFAGIYTDEGITGTSTKRREQFNRLMDDCRAGLIDRVLVKSASRFARNTADALSSVRELKSLGVTVAFEKEGFDTETSNGEMLLSIICAVAQEESLSISQNMKWGIHKRMRTGNYITNATPFGYTQINHQLVPEKNNAMIVNDIFKSYLSGMSINEIAEHLNTIYPKENSKWNPRTIHAQLGMGESTALFPAFIINGQEVDEIYISKYLNIVQNGRAYSLPGVDPAANMNFDQARSYCEAKGDGWHCMTRMEWGLLMRICEMQGFIPLGNNNYGKHSSEQFYKAIKTYDDSGKTGRTATGTGPLTWYHDNSPSGIADPVGDVWEWAGGVRTVYGELQVMANNNGADAANSQGTSSTKWMAISADDGSYITPDGSGTTANSVKLDIVSGHIQWSKTITTRNKDSDWPSCSFAAITCDSTISDAAKLVLQCLGMLPYKATDLCAKAGHRCWFRNLDAERAFFSGGSWNSSSFGLASFDGGRPRSSSGTSIGFRAAFVKLPTA